MKRGLSNTAIPKYYGRFRQDVIDGKIPVCETISLEMNRIDQLIANPGVYYDEAAVEGYIKFCERELTLTDGSDMFLLDSFKLWAEQIYGWYYFINKTVYVPNKGKPGGRYVRKSVKHRLIQKQYLIVGRGASKTLYAATHQAYGVAVDTSTTKQVVTAPTMIQAEETVAPIRTAITRARGPLFQFLTMGNILNTKNTAERRKLTPTKKGIENFLTNSIIQVRPMSIDKLQGMQNKYTTVDEWLSGDIREDVIGALEQGASKVKDWLIVATSSEGTVRNGPGDTIKMELMSILRGEYINPHVSIWWYKLDDISEVGQPEMWVKANPNIGITVPYEAYQQEVERAEKAPSTRNDMLAKRFGIPTEGFTYFFTYEETLPHRPREFWQMPCALGADLSQGDDFCAFTFLFPLRDGSFGIKVRSYITDRTYHRLQPAMKKKYDDFLKEGTLQIMNGTILDMDEVFDDLISHIEERGYEVAAFGYDPYNAKTFVERFVTEYGPHGVEKVIQGSKTESVPLGELKKLAEDRQLLFDEELMAFSMGNSIVLVDTNNNKKLYKRRNEEKIDNVASTMDAYIAYKRCRDFFE